MPVTTSSITFTQLRPPAVPSKPASRSPRRDVWSRLNHPKGCTPESAQKQQRRAALRLIAAAPTFSSPSQKHQQQQQQSPRCVRYSEPAADVCDGVKTPFPPAVRASPEMWQVQAHEEKEIEFTQLEADAAVASEEMLSFGKPLRQQHLTGAARRAVSSPLPPWACERAWQDQPPREIVLQRRQAYCRMLDEQAKQKHEQAQKIVEESIHLDMTTATSPTFPEIPLDRPFLDAAHLTQLSKGALLAEMEWKQQKATAEREAEKAAYRELVNEENARLNEQWTAALQKQKKVQSNLRDTWEQAVREKQAREQNERAARLQDERQLLERISQSMVPLRRLKRPKDTCLQECLQPVCVSMSPKRPERGAAMPAQLPQEELGPHIEGVAQWMQHMRAA